MIFTETALKGSFVIDLEKRGDQRGFFARTFCQDEFGAHGLETLVAQCNISYSAHAGTLRGMHFQNHPFGEAKLVRCIAGAVFDVIVDLRPGSATFKRWFGVELSAANHRSVYIPKGFAHGAQTLQDDTELFYQMSAEFNAAAASGVRWDDPAFGIAWPEPPASGRHINERDRSWPGFEG